MRYDMYPPEEKMNSFIPRANDWIYIYKIVDNLIIFDRSVSRHGLGLVTAKEVVKKWEKLGYESFYTIGVLVKKPALN